MYIVYPEVRRTEHTWVQLQVRVPHLTRNLFISSVYDQLSSLVTDRDIVFLVGSLQVDFLKKYFFQLFSTSALSKFWISQIFTESVICLFTDSSVKKYFSLSNQSTFTEIISEIWLIYSNLFLAIWISQISLIISRFWLIQI